MADIAQKRRERLNMINTRVVVKKQDSTYRFFIPELGIKTSANNLSEGFLELEKLKAKYFDDLVALDLDQDLPPGQESAFVQAVRKHIGTGAVVVTICALILFLFQLSVAMMANNLRKTWVAAVSDTSGVLESQLGNLNLKDLSPEERAEKLERYKIKVEALRSNVKEFKPFIEVTKPLINDLKHLASDEK